MKKILFFMPLMAVLLLANCGGSKPPVDQFNITFDANGGVLSGDSSIKVDDGTFFKDITNMPTASKTPAGAYPFNGWGLTKDTQIPIDDYKITNDLTVYAIYTPNAATVTFSKNSSDCTLQYDGKTYLESESFIIPAGIDVILTINSVDGYFPILEGDVKITNAKSYSFNLAKKEIIIKVDKDERCVIEAKAEEGPRENLEAYSWPEISQLSEMGLADICFDVGDTKKVQLNHQDLDSDGVIDDDEVYQTVRIIGLNHDIDPSGKALGITFEFVEYISDKYGYSLATLWQDTSTTESANFDYANSTVRKNLTGEGKGISGWYEKESDEKSITYKDETLFSMLPDALQFALKITRKKVNIKVDNSWIPTDVDDTLFLLSTKEIGYSNTYAEDVATYSYYEGHTEKTDTIRIKKQIKGTEGALTGFTPITESEFGTGSSSAGYNASNEDYGGLSWLRSPYTDSSGFGGPDLAWRVYTQGTLGSNGVYQNALAIAPAFCI